MCADACALLESIPIAALGNFEVITVNYRMAPEARHPAALEDVEKVYRRLLPHHKASSIGIYGCSAGGALTGADSPPGCQRKGLPQPGAIGIFGAGGVRFMAGDSAYIAGYIDGSFPPPPKPGEVRVDMTRGYFCSGGPETTRCSPRRCIPEIDCQIPAHPADHRHPRDGHEPGDRHQFGADQGQGAMHPDRRRGHGALLYLQCRTCPKRAMPIRRLSISSGRI